MHSFVVILQSFVLQSFQNFSKLKRFGIFKSIYFCGTINNASSKKVFEKNLCFTYSCKNYGFMKVMIKISLFSYILCVLSLRLDPYCSLQCDRPEHNITFSALHQ